jgi:hypothetical protein
LCLALLAPTNARVGKRKNVDDGSLRKGDVMAIDFNTIFDFARVDDLSKLKFTVQQSAGEAKPADLGTVYGGVNEPFMNYTYKEDLFKGIAFTKYLDERSYVIISQDGKIVYEETSANGSPRNYENPKTFNLKLIGDKYACHDVIPWGDDLSKLVVACISRNVMTAENTIWIQILNRSDMTAVGDVYKYTLSVDDSFRVFNRIGLLQVMDNGKPYLVVHDQGKSHYVPPSSSSTSTEVSNDYVPNGFTSMMKYFFEETEQKQVKAIVRNNTNFLVFKLSSDQFAYNNEYQVKSGDTQAFSQVLEYNWFGGHFVVTSQLKTGGTINIAVCDLKIVDTTSTDVQVIDCDKAPAATKVTDGFVGQIIGSQFWANVFYNEDGKTMKVEIWNTHGNIKSVGQWDLLHSMDKIAVPEGIAHKWIRGVQGNSHNIVIKFTSLDETTLPAATADSDSIVISWELNVANNHPGWSANVHDNNVYYGVVTKTSIYVARLSGAWWMASGSDFGAQLTNEVSFTCEDPGSNSVTIIATIHQASGSKKIDLGGWKPPYLDIHQDSLLQLPFDYRSIKAGNDLTFSVEIKD